VPQKAATTPSSWWSSKPASTSASPDGGRFESEIVEQRLGFCVLRFSGKRVAETFRDEAGGHRWQRVPPTERRGRIHTSTITVAVLPEPAALEVQLDERDLEETMMRGSGAGGQHRNKTDSAVRLLHRPTGLVVRCESERDQSQNRRVARAVLRARLWELEQTRVTGARDAARRAQVGSGMRGDKRRTVRTQDDQVVDTITGRSWRFKDYERGAW
jgi:peptide chain release factor 1